QRVALHRHAPRATYQSDQIIERHSLRGVRTRFVVDLLLHHGAFEVVHAERQRSLRQAWRHHYPVTLDVIEIVEKEPADREVAKIVEARRGGSLASEL